MINPLRFAAFTLATLALFASSVCAQFKTAEPVPQQYAAGFNSITPTDSRELLTKLVSTEFGGRGSGQEGFFKAAKWYAQQLEKRGFKPGGTDGTWFQNVPLLKVGVKDTHLKLAGAKFDAKFGMSTFVGEGKAEGDIVFLNLTSATADIGKSEDYNGKIVVYQVAQPQRQGRRRFFRPQMPATLRDAKPGALIRVTTNAILSDRVSDPARGGRPTPPGGTPSVSLNVKDANALAKACHLSPDFFAAGPKTDMVATAKARANMQIEVLRETVEVPNVIGWYEGSDPDLKHEHVGLGAHLDHLGMRGDQMYPGADDNGSGSTALLQIAKAIHTNPVKPKRSVFLIVFCGEEIGLVGSKYYVANPTRPTKDMVCMLNVDMIGRNEKNANETADENADTLHLVGSKRISTELHDLTIKANKHIGFRFEYDEEGVYTRSDHYNFAKKGIPITFIFAGFDRKYYHQTADTIEGINFQKIVNGARLNYLCTMMAAEHGHFAKNAEE